VSHPAAEHEARTAVGPPLGLLAELTHRCPLRCPYCSNPLTLERRSDELSTDTWKRVLAEAAALGVLQVHLSGGEPTARNDLEELVRHCREVGLYSNLITAGINLPKARLATLAEAGLDHVQLSVQAAAGELNDTVSGLAGSFEQKMATAAAVRALDLPLTINTVIHRRTIGDVDRMIQMALDLGARRIEIAHAQYYGWALENRRALMPRWDQVEAAAEIVEKARAELKGRLVIDGVVPDYYARYPKPCMGGWARQSLNVTPSGTVLPCHAAETLKDLEFPNVREASLRDIWFDAPAFNRFRGTDWMPEPCRSCDRRDVDWGGCRCQALAITGDAAATDPACSKSDWHERMTTIAGADARGRQEYIYRGVRFPAQR
jgi:pyrroloquinoline quinone biosynthesis protein E